MFIGHAAVGFACKAAAPRTSLGWLMFAPLFLDLLWPLFLIVGLESVRIDPGNTVVTPFDLHDYPYSHSLVMALVWSVLVAAAYAALHRDSRVAGLLMGGVFSHWLLDFVTHRPDMPLAPGSATYLGLGLWNSKLWTLLIEGAMFGGALWLYLRTTRPRDRVGSIALWSFVGLLLFSYAGAMFGPPPPSVGPIKWAALASWLFVPWAWWIDRHREARA